MREERDALVFCLFSPKFRTLEFGGRVPERTRVVDVRRTEGAGGVAFDFVFCLGIMSFDDVIARAVVE